MAKLHNFVAGQFTATQFDSAAQKAKFANHFIRFVECDFKETLFPKWFYKTLSNTFGHIAHFDQRGFYATFFTSTAGKVRFLQETLNYPYGGDPKFTYSDVEAALRVWLIETDKLSVYMQRLHQEIEAGERAQLARLKTKYEGA